MNCWNCNAPIKEPLFGKIPFRAECDVCNASLHCCRNCVYYKPGLPNDCAVPGTDFIADRSAMNLCEEFKILGHHIPKSNNISQVENQLFKNTSSKPETKKKDFDSFFKDT